MKIDRLIKKSSIVKSALVHDDYVYKVKMLSYQMEGTVPDFQKDSYGPHQEENQFGKLHDFFSIYDSKGKHWHLYQNGSAVTMVHFSSTSYESREYPSTENYVLAAAVSGSKGEFYYLMVEKGSKGTNAKNAVMYRANTDSSSIIR